MKNISQTEIEKFKDLIENNSIDEVAKILGVSRRTVYNYMKELGLKSPNSKITLALKKLKK